MTAPSPAWDSAFLSDRGAVRKVNEDSYLEAPGLGLWEIADGMVGHEAGQMASAALVCAFTIIWTRAHSCWACAF